MSHSSLALSSLLPSHDTDTVFLSSENFACWLTFINDLMKNSCAVPYGFGLNGVTLIYCQLVSTLAPLPFTTCRSVHYCHHNKRLRTIYPSVCLARSREACFLPSLLWEHYLRWPNVSDTTNEISKIELIEVAAGQQWHSSDDCCHSWHQPEKKEVSNLVSLSKHVQV